MMIDQLVQKNVTAKKAKKKVSFLTISQKVFIKDMKSEKRRKNKHQNRDFLNCFFIPKD